MSADWPVVSIDDIKAGSKGSIAIGPFGSRMKSDCYVDKGVPVIRGTNITGGPTFEGNFVYITKEKAETLGSSNVYQYDLVFPHRGSIGEVGIILDDEHFVLSSSLMKLTCDLERVNPKFVYYFFKSRIGRHELLKNASQVGTPGIGQPLTSLKSIELRLPPLEIQNSIEEMLTSLDEKINLNRQTNQTLEHIAQAIFKSWFVDFEPTRAKIAAIEAGECPERAAMAAISGKSLVELDQLSNEQQAKLKTTAALFPDALVDSELGEVPVGWGVKTLDEKIVPKKGKNITHKTITPGDVPVVAGGLTPAYYHNAHNVTAPVITISASGANAGFINLYHQHVWASDCSFINREEFSCIYSAYLFLKSRQDEITHMQQGAAQPHVYPKDLARLVLVDPPKTIWMALENVIKPFFEKIKNNIDEEVSLGVLRDSLLPKLLSGELSIETTQTELEGVG